MPILEQKPPQKNLFGEDIIEDDLLRKRFIEPPFSVLDTKQGNWKNRKAEWLNLGIKSEVGREATQAVGGLLATFNEYDSEAGKSANRTEFNTSIFDPALTELMYRWFCEDGGLILDPFAGGSVRGIVAHYLGYRYIGLELRGEQVQSNIEQGLEILEEDNQPDWRIGDSDVLLDAIEEEQADLVFSCPPYADLEVYSELEADLSNMDYADFLSKYESIIKKSIEKLKTGCYAIFVVGEVRDKHGMYYNFVGDTKSLFIKHGAKLYNDCVLLTSLGSACLRAGKVFDASKKLTKIHQNVLVFKKI